MKRYAIFLIKDNSIRFYCYASKQEAKHFFTSEHTWQGVKWFSRLLTGQNLLEIEEKKNLIIA